MTMKNRYIRMLLLGLLGGHLLLATACSEPESVSATGNLKPTVLELTGTWQFDSLLSGNFAGTHLTFRDSMRFSAYGRGFSWMLDENIITGQRHIPDDYTESVRIVITSMNSATHQDEEGNPYKVKTMTIMGYFALTNVSALDTFWTFYGSLTQQ